MFPNKKPPQLVSTLDELAQQPDYTDSLNTAVEWFADEPRMPTQDFIDKFCDYTASDGWELREYDSPAAKHIVKAARALRKNMEV